MLVVKKCTLFDLPSIHSNRSKGRPTGLFSLCLIVVSFDAELLDANQGFPSNVSSVDQPCLSSRLISSLCTRAIIALLDGYNPIQRHGQQTSNTGVPSSL